MTVAAATTRPMSQRSSWHRYRHSLWLLTKRDLAVRYRTNVLGYLWSIIDPLLMAAVFYFVFTVIFHRGGAGESPYIVFLLTGLLPWTWFNGAVSDATRAFRYEARIIRSTAIPPTIWVFRLVLAKGIEFLLALPVLALFAILFRAHVTWELVYFIPAIVLQAALCTGVGLIVAPLCVFFKDFERAFKLLLRLLFYGSTVMFQVTDLPADLRWVIELNPLVGIFGLYRAGFFPGHLSGAQVLIAAIGCLVFLALGAWVFSRSVRSVLKAM